MRSAIPAAVVAAALAGAAPDPALAQGLSFHGILAQDHVANTFTGRQNAGLADLTLRLAPGVAGPIGFDAGIFGYINRNEVFEARELVGFAALTFGVGAGEVQIGAPRSALHGLSDHPVLAGAAAHVAIGGAMTGDAPMSTYLSGFIGDPMLGIRYQHQAGPVTFAATAGQFTGDDRVASASAVWQGAAARVFVGVEGYQSPFGSNLHTQIGGSVRVQTGLGPVTLGGAVTRTDLLIPVRTTSLFASAAVTDRLELTAIVAHRTLGPGLRIGSIAARYALPGGLAVNLGAYRDQTASDTIWSIGLQRRF